MFAHETHVRVRYAETDQMGVVYHSHYIAYFEVGRAEMIRDMGLTYADMEARGVIMPVTEVRVKYMRPARYDDLLRLRTRMKEMPGKRITMVTEVFNEKDEHLVTGEVTLAFLDARTGRSTPAPDFFLELLEKYAPSEHSVKTGKD